MALSSRKKFKKFAYMPACSNEVLLLPAIIDIQTVQTLMERLSDCTQRTLVLDASQVERITTPGIQLLLSAAKSLESHECTCTFQSPTDSFTQAFTTLGLLSELQLRSNYV